MEEAIASFQGGGMIFLHAVNIVVLMIIFFEAFITILVLFRFLKQSALMQIAF